MSDDLVKMLKEDEGRDVCKEMADVFPCSSSCPCALELRVLADSDELDRLRAENERLRAALEKINRSATYPVCITINPRGYDVRTPSKELVELIVETARAAPAKEAGE